MFVRCSTDDKKQDWSSYTCIIPAVSIGNVGQLTVDLLLSTLEVTKLGYFHTDSVLPVIGNNPFPKSSSETEKCQMVTSSEVYENASKKLIIVQIRSKVVQHKRKQFVTNLLSWIKEMKFQRLIVLSSTAAHERLDSQLTGSTFRYISSPELDKTQSLTQKFGWKELELRDAVPGLDAQATSQSQQLYIPGGGITKLLYTECCRENVPVAVLLLFCSEGDNLPDAMTLASHLNGWLNLTENSTSRSHPWKIPASWKFLFGNDAPMDIY